MLIIMVVEVKSELLCYLQGYVYNLSDNFMFISMLVDRFRKDDDAVSISVQD
jgi:hypothetical protein